MKWVSEWRWVIGDKVVFIDSRLYADGWNTRGISERGNEYELWEVLLTQDEIDALADGLCGLPIRPPDVQMYWDWSSRFWTDADIDK